MRAPESFASSSRPSSAFSRSWSSCSAAWICDAACVAPVLPAAVNCAASVEPSSARVEDAPPDRFAEAEALLARLAQRFDPAALRSLGELLRQDLDGDEGHHRQR